MLKWKKVRLVSRCPKCNKKKCKCHEFSCEDGCQKTIPTKKYPSPNSPLPEKDLDELQKCIEISNDLLRSLGNKPEPDNTRQLQLHLMELKGKYIDVTYLFGEIEEELGEEIEEVEYSSEIVGGTVVTAGRDFLQISVLGKSIYILYNRIISIALNVKKDCIPMKDDSMINRKDMRELVFNFGEFVSKDLELINLYFGIPLYKHLKNARGEDVKVIKEDRQIFKGTLIEIEENRITILNKDDEVDIDFNEISLLEVFV